MLGIKQYGRRLKKNNFDPKLIDLMRSLLYSNQKAQVRLENAGTDNYKMGKGVRYPHPHHLPLQPFYIVHNERNT